jgi:hypothetical protein
MFLIFFSFLFRLFRKQNIQFLKEAKWGLISKSEKEAKGEQRRNEAEIAYVVLRPHQRSLHQNLHLQMNKSFELINY